MNEKINISETETILPIKSVVCSGETAAGVFDGDLRLSYLLPRNEWMKVKLTKKQNISAFWISSSFGNLPTLTMKWADNQTTESTLFQTNNLIKLNSRKTTNSILIKSNKKIGIQEMIFFGWRRSEMIDFVVILFFLVLFNMF